MKYFTSEEKQNIKHAKSIDLVKFLINSGIQLKKENSYYRHNEFSSLLIQGNKWYWNKSKINGDSINYLTNSNFEFKYGFKQAVDELCKFGGVYISNDDDKEEFNINNIELTKDRKRAIAYLNKTRHIDNKIIDYLIKNGLMAQTKKYNNIAFLMKDENKNIVGAETNTTLSNKRYKGLLFRSKYGYGFNITNTNRPKNSLYFESAIDLLSFMQYIGIDKAIKKLDTCILISLAGLKENVLKHMQYVYNNPRIFLCTDNDKASMSFIETIKTKYNVSLYLPDKKYKDWNDIIKNKS